MYVKNPKKRPQGLSLETSIILAIIIVSILISTALPILFASMSLSGT